MNSRNNSVRHTQSWARVAAQGVSPPTTALSLPESHPGEGILINLLPHHAGESALAERISYLAEQHALLPRTQFGARKRLSTCTGVNGCARKDMSGVAEQTGLDPRQLLCGRPNKNVVYIGDYGAAKYPNSWSNGLKPSAYPPKHTSSYSFSSPPLPSSACWMSIHIHSKPLDHRRTWCSR